MVGWWQTMECMVLILFSSYMGRIKLLHHGAPMRRPNISTPPPTTNQVWRRGSLISLDWPGTLTQTIASSWPRLLSIFVQTKDMNRNPATIFSKLDIIACNIRIFVFETKDMYGSGNVSTTQHSTEITPKTSNINQVSKKTTTFTIHQSTWGVLSRQPLPSTFCWSKVQTPRLIIIYDIPSMFLTSSPDLEAGNSRSLVPARCIWWCGGTSLGI